MPLLISNNGQIIYPSTYPNGLNIQNNNINYNASNIGIWIGIIGDLDYCKYVFTTSDTTVPGLQSVNRAVLVTAMFAYDVFIKSNPKIGYGNNKDQISDVEVSVTPFLNGRGSRRVVTSNPRLADMATFLLEKNYNPLDIANRLNIFNGEMTRSYLELDKELVLELYGKNPCNDITDRRVEMFNAYKPSKHIRQ